MSTKKTSKKETSTPVAAPSVRNYTLNYINYDPETIEKIQPEIIKVLDESLGKDFPDDDSIVPDTLDEAVRKRVGIDDICVEYVGMELDKEVNKYFPKFIVYKQDTHILDTLTFTRYLFDPKTYTAERQVISVNVTYDRDLANEPDLAAHVVDGALTAHLNNGWFLTDDEAIADGLFDVEHALAQLAVNSEYGKLNCHTCAGRTFRNLAECMRRIRLLKRTRDELINDGVEIPDVLPNNMNEYEPINGKLVKMSPEVEVIKHTISGEQKKKLTSILEEITSDKLD